MSSMSLVEVMQKRSRKFYEYALRALERGDYDMVMFMCEQAAQLRLKALLLRILGFTPRSHQLRELLGTLLKTIESFGKPELAREVQNFIDEYREDLRALEEAYTGSRYLAGVYVEEDASEAVRVVENLFKLLEVIEDNVFS